MNSKLNTPPIANICIKVLYFDNRLTSIFLFLFQRDKLNLKNETIISLIAIIKNGIANSSNSDVVIIDTAGRLQNSENLMNELEKVYRVISKLSNKITVVMNIDANIGQNSISQIENFSKYIPIENVILNKMDGTSKGGIVMSVIDKFQLPVSFIGVGEKMEDLIEFDIDDYLKSLINSTDNN